jgi:hypothetical protein
MEGHDDIDISEIDIFKDLEGYINNMKERMSFNGDTAKTWVQYMQMVNLLNSFIYVERTGSWHDSLETLHHMIPYFLATGHNINVIMCTYRIWRIWRMISRTPFHLENIVFADQIGHMVVFGLI